MWPNAAVVVRSVGVVMIAKAAAAYEDPRDIMQAVIMLNDGYTDQPYCAVNDRSNPPEWSCVVTGHLTHGETGGGQHVMSVVSTNHGQSWEGPFTVERGVGDGPEGLPNAYGNILLAPTLNDGKGRLFTIYNLNSHNFTNVTGRDDELGNFFMRYSDTGGRSWSQSRFLVPYRSTWIDHSNTFRGRVRIMWTVDQIKVRDGVVYFAFTKIGRYVQNPPEEIFILSSPNLLTEPETSKVTWRLLPNGDHGIAAPVIWNPNTTVMEEGHVLPLQLSHGFYAMARTQRGYLAAAKTSSPTAANGWGSTFLARYYDNSCSHLPLAPSAGATRQIRPLGDVRDPKNHYIFRAGLKSPRGPFTPKLLEHQDGEETGRYLLIYYNNHGAARNPYWLSVGLETEDGEILWSQPELVVYDRDTHAGTSAGGYPDFIQEADGSVHITACQKGLPTNSTARLLTIEPSLLAGLLRQHISSSLPSLGPEVAAVNFSHAVAIPALSQTANITTARQGWSLMLVVREHYNARPGDVLLHSTPSSDADDPSVRYGQKITPRGGGVITNAGITLSVPEPSAPKRLPACPAKHCNGIPSTDMTDFYCNDVLQQQQQLRRQGKGAQGPKEQGGRSTDCCTTFRVDRGDKLAGTCAPNNQTMNTTAGSPSLRFSFADGVGGLFETEMDPACAAMLSGGASVTTRHTELSGGRSNSTNDGTHDLASPSHFIGIVVDAGPELVSWVVDGVLCDGGGVLSAGYSWVPKSMNGLPPTTALVAAPAGRLDTYGGAVVWGQLVTMALRTSELVAAYRATVIAGNGSSQRVSTTKAE